MKSRKLAYEVMGLAFGRDLEIAFALMKRVLTPLSTPPENSANTASPFAPELWHAKAKIGCRKQGSAAILGY